MSALKPSSLSRWDSSLLLWHEGTRSTAPPPQIGCQSNATAPPPPPAFHQASLTIHQYPLILLGGERHGDSKVFCPGTLLNDLVKSQTQTFWPWLLTAISWATLSPPSTEQSPDYEFPTIKIEQNSKLPRRAWMPPRNPILTCTLLLMARFRRAPTAWIQTSLFGTVHSWKWAAMLV